MFIFSKGQGQRLDHQTFFGAKFFSVKFRRRSFAAVVSQSQDLLRVLSDGASYPSFDLDNLMIVKNPSFTISSLHIFCISTVQNSLKS